MGIRLDERVDGGARAGQNSSWRILDILDRQAQFQDSPKGLDELEPYETDDQHG